MCSPPERGMTARSFTRLGSKMDTVCLAADKMPLRVGDKVVDNDGHVLVVVACSREGDQTIVCKTPYGHRYCARRSREIVHSPSCWQGEE